MSMENRAVRIRLFDFSSVPMRAFHMSWFAFFLCFFAWFGIAPLMKVVREEMQLSREQIGWCIIGSVSMTIFARLAIGWLCDRIGPRLAYTWLLAIGSIPVMMIGLARSFETFLICRLLIGVIGASFVITQYHTSVMFAPNCVGTANATTAGWGNLGGGVTQLVMPLVFAFFVSVLGLSDYWSWRAAMVVAGLLCLGTGIAYYFLTQDCPEGNYCDLRRGRRRRRAKSDGTFWDACRDIRVWALFVLYGACFGIELTINNIAALYFSDYFGLGLQTAGVAAALFGLMNLFTRTLGGMIGDRFGGRWGLRGRAWWLFMALFCEGLCLILFSQMTVLMFALPALVLFSLFVQMSSGATFSVVPFINRKALGSVAGIVGAGGNAGAVAAGFLFKSSLPWPTALLVLGVLVTICSSLALTVRFSNEAEGEARTAFAAAEASRAQPAFATFQT
ncbi:MAG: MFS transporter [Gemmatales bacterium]|nr:MAG: MFS transporter [Gemmatales bacterium]